MKINTKPAGKFLGAPFVYQFPSTSRENLYHHVLIYPDHRGIQCTCDGWRSHGRCWHIERVPSFQTLLKDLYAGKQAVILPPGPSNDQPNYKEAFKDVSEHLIRIGDYRKDSEILQEIRQRHNIQTVDLEENTDAFDVPKDS